MRKVLWILAVLVVVLSFGLYAAETQVSTKAEVKGNKILNAGYNAIQGKAGVGEVSFEKISTEKGEFVKITADNGTFFTAEIGAPALPVISRLIEVPFGARPEIRIIDYKTMEINLADYGYDVPVYPAQPSYSKSTDLSKVEFQFDKSAYAVNSFVKGELGSIEVRGVMRDTRIARVHFEPFSYNPAENKLRVAYDIEYEILLPGAGRTETEMMKERYGSPIYSSALKGIQLYNDKTDHPNLADHEFVYLIISYPDFADEMTEFVNWKTKKGYHVIHVTTDETGTTTSDIDQYIETMYTDSDTPPDFILLVGDKDQIPAKSGSSAGQATDLYYGCVGADNIPDIYYGRFSANSVSELTPQIEKTLWYEKAQYETDYDLSYLGKVVLAAGMDGNFGPTHGNGQINYGTEHYFNGEHGITSDTYLYPQSGSNAANIVSHISDGRAFYNYTAHGSQTSFSDPSFTISDIEGLDNEYEYPFVIGNCCLTGSFQVGECFGEAWLRKEDKGAMGFIGGSESTYWDEDYWWGVGYSTASIDGNAQTYEATGIGAYDGLFHDHGETMDEWYTANAAVMFRGNLAVEASTSTRKLYYWETYHLFGDPSVVTQLGVPEAIAPTHEEVIIIGSETFQIDAGVPNALIALSKDGELFGTALTGTDGIGIVDFGAPLTEVGTFDIVITAQNKIPYMETIQAVVPATVHFSASSIPYGTPTNIIVTVKDGDDVNPIQGVSIWAAGLDYLTDAVTTDANGEAALEIDYPYGPSVTIVGQEPGAGYFLFEEEVAMSGTIDLANPEISVITDFGMVDTLALNLPGVIDASCETAGFEFWAPSVCGEPMSLQAANSLEFTATDLNNVPTVIAKEGFNIYRKDIPVVEAYGKIYGMVENEAGDGLANVNIYVFDMISDELVLSLVTDNSGYYEIEDDMLCDNYKLEASKFGFNPYEEIMFMNYGSNEHDITLTAAESGRLRGSIMSGDVPVTNADIQVFKTDDMTMYLESQTDAAGHYEFELPYFNHYMIKIIADGYLTIVTEEFGVSYNMIGDFEAEVFTGTSETFEETDGGLTATDGWEWGEDSDAGAHSGTKVWGTVLNGDYEVSAHYELTTPEVALDGTWVLSWYHWREFEGSKDSDKPEKTPYDGGNVKISTNGGTSWEILDDFFVSTEMPDWSSEEEYTGTIATSYNNPLGGEETFVGSSDGWVRVTLDLSEYQDQNAMFKFDFGSDTSVLKKGWYIDDLFIGPIYSTIEPPFNPDAIGDNESIPAAFALKQNYPNPFNPETTIEFDLNVKSNIELSIYNVSGQLIKTVREGELNAGTYKVVWNGTDLNGNSVSSGIYYYRLKTDDKTSTKKMLLLK